MGFAERYYLGVKRVTRTVDAFLSTMMSLWQHPINVVIELTLSTLEYVEHNSTTRAWPVFPSVQSVRLLPRTGRTPNLRPLDETDAKL